jgi:hypothetical protein
VNITQKLRQLHTDIVAAKDGFKIVGAWALAERLLLRLPVNLDEASRVFEGKDTAGLLAMIEKIEKLERLDKPSAQRAAPAGPLPAFAHEDLAAALRAFKHRLKVVRLNDESRLGGRYTSGGKSSKIDAIEPPNEFDPAVWKVLARAGQLRDTGGGFYALPAGQQQRP